MQIVATYKTQPAHKCTANADSTRTVDIQVGRGSDSIVLSPQALTLKQKVAAKAPTVGTLVGAAAGVVAALAMGTPAAMLQWPLYTTLAGRVVGRQVARCLDPNTANNENAAWGTVLGAAAGAGYAMGSDHGLLSSVLIGSLLGREAGHLIAEA
jgi:hypothetical protein